MNAVTYFDEREFEDLARRTVDLDLLTMGALTRWCERECNARGVPFQRISEDRWNAHGERIGPRLEISHDAAEIILSVAVAMAEARDRELERVLQRRA